MPKLYEYFGLVILFYSREHEPIHVHCKYQGKESKAEIIFEDGKFLEVRGKEPLDTKNLKKFKKLIETISLENGLTFLFTIKQLNLKK